MFKFQVIITFVFLIFTTNGSLVFAEPQSSCYQGSELVRLASSLSGFKPQVFSPDSHRVILANQKGQKILFDLQDSKIRDLGMVQNPSFSSDGSILSYETSGESSEIMILDLKQNTVQKIPEKNLCGHKISEKYRNLTLLTCQGEFKTYDLKSSFPRLLNIKKVKNTFTSGSTHFNLDSRASFVLTHTSGESPSSTLHLIDFERARVYSAPMTPPRFSDLMTYLSNLSAPNTPPELQNIISRNFRNQGGARVSPDGQSALIWNSYDSVVHIQLDQQKQSSLLSQSNPSTTFSLSPQGSWVFEQNDTIRAPGHEGKIGSKLKIRFDSVTFSNDDSRIAYTTPDQSQIKIREVKTGKELTIESHTQDNKPDTLSFIKEGSYFFDAKSNQLLVYQIVGEQAEIKFYDAKTGKLAKSLPLSRTTNNITNRAFLEGGQKLLLGDAPYVVSGTSDIIDLKTGEVETLGVSIPHLTPILDSKAHPNMIIWPYMGYSDTFLHIRSICSPLNTDSPCFNHSQPDEIFNLALQLPSHLNTAHDLPTVIKECKNHQKRGSFNQKMLHSIDDRLKTLKDQPPTSEELESLLLVTQSDLIPFNPKTTLALLESADRLGIFNHNPTLLQNSLIRVFDQDKGLYFDLIEKYAPVLKSNLDSLPQSCFSSLSIQSMQKNLVSYLLNSSINPIPFSKVKRLQPVSPLLKRLDTKDFNQSMEALGLAVAKAAQHDFPGVMASTLYYFISPQIRETILGQPAPHYTELSFIRDDGHLSPVILSTHEIDSDPKTRSSHGLYAKTFTGAPLTQYTWDTGGNHYTANVYLKQVSADQLFPDRTGPDYQSLWKDQKLTGMILLSSNLGRDAQILGDEYMHYFKDQGFSFEWFNSKIQDVPTFLKEKIISGELDYLLKDAHSGGVQQDLVTLMNQADLKIGTRQLPDGRSEKILIVVPANNSTPRTISTSDFGSWVNERELNGQGELVYFNTSCFGGERAASDVASAATSRLLVIPVHPRQTTTFFVNQPIDATYQLLESIRKEKDFEGFRENLKNAPDYKIKAKNTFLMPDDADYQELIVRQLQNFPVNARTEIHDQTGKEIHFDPLH